MCWNCCLLYPFNLVLKPHQGGYMGILLDSVNMSKDIIPATQMSEPCSPWSIGIRHPLWHDAMCLAHPHLVGYRVSGFCPCPISPTKTVCVMLFFCQCPLMLTTIMCTVLCLWWLLQDFLGKSDPFLQVSKVKADGGTLLVHRTEVNMTYMYLDPPYHGMGFLHHKKTCPTLPSTGPIFSGKGTGHFSSSGEQIRSWYLEQTINYFVELLVLYLCQLII